MGITKIKLKFDKVTYTTSTSEPTDCRISIITISQQAS